MDENTFWVRIAQSVATALCFIVGSCSVKDYYTERNVVEAIKAGSSPIAARCAIYGTGGHDVLCSLESKNR